MKKITSVNIGEKLFQIEEDAYNYLNHILNGQWKRHEMEIQIGSLLEKKINSTKKVITYSDVVDALNQLGISASGYESSGRNFSKKLYRQPQGRVLGGVCTGIGEYLDIDPILVRVLFVLGFFMGSLGFWLYIILWIIIPKNSFIK